MSETTLNVYSPSLFQRLLSHSWEVEASFFVFYWIIYLLSRKFSGVFVPTYNSLSIAKKIEWDSRVSSTVNALYITYGACCTLYQEPNIWFYNPFHHTSPASYYYFSALLGYFLYDTVLVLMQKVLFTPSTIVHHLLGLWLYGLATLYNVNHYNMVIFATTELSTPFVNMRWFLSTCNAKDGTLYFANGLTMAVSFLIVRAIVVPLFSCYTITFQRDLLMQLDPAIIYQLYAGLAIIITVNTYWTYLIWSGLIKVMRQRKPAQLKSFPSKQA